MARTMIFKFRLTPEEKLIITYLASLARRSESDFVRCLIERAAEMTPTDNTVYRNNKLCLFEQSDDDCKGVENGS